MQGRLIREVEELVAIRENAVSIPLEALELRNGKIAGQIFVQVPGKG